MSNSRVSLHGSERPRPPYHKHLGPVRDDHMVGVTIMVRSKPGSPKLRTLDDWQKMMFHHKSTLLHLLHSLRSHGDEILLHSRCERNGT